MAKKLYGFDRLRADVLDIVSEHVDYLRENMEGDSPIERLLLSALSFHLEHGGRVYERLLVPRTGSFESLVDALADHNELHTSVIVQPQFQFPDWRVDFLISVLDKADYVARIFTFRRLIVECDGHDFHERTPDQASRDRSRDRAVQLGGTQVFRFTGRELWRDPWACAAQVADWAERS